MPHVYTSIGRGWSHQAWSEFIFRIKMGGVNVWHSSQGACLPFKPLFQLFLPVWNKYIFFLPTLMRATSCVGSLPRGTKTWQDQNKTVCGGYNASVGHLEKLETEARIHQTTDHIQNCWRGLKAVFWRYKNCKHLIKYLYALQKYLFQKVGSAKTPDVWTFSSRPGSVWILLWSSGCSPKRLTAWTVDTTSTPTARKANWAFFFHALSRPWSHAHTHCCLFLTFACGSAKQNKVASLLSSQSSDSEFWHWE